MDYKQKLEVARAVNAPAANAVQWLEDHAPAERPRWLRDFKHRHVAEVLLRRRSDPAINIALAQFGTHVPTLQKLYRSGNKIAQLAVLTNVMVGPSGFLDPASVLATEDVVELVRQFPATQEQLQAYFENPHISRNLVGKIVKREEPFDFVPEVTLMYIVAFLSKNSLISEEYDDTYLDGFAEYDHNRLFFDLWSLVGSVPATQGWARVLTELVHNLAIPFMGKEINVGLLERWRIETPAVDETEKTNEGIGQAESEGIKTESQPDNTASDEDNQETGETDFDPRLYSSFYLRQALAISFLKHETESSTQSINPNHEDKAVRLAYYTACEPGKLFGYGVYDEEFRYPHFKYLGEEGELEDETQREVVEKCKELLERDKNEFIENLIYNENFWRRSEERELLSTLAWDLAEDSHHTMDVPNTLRAREAYFIKEKPEFFKDDEFVDTTEDAPLETLAREILDRIRELEDRFEDIQVSELVSEQRTLYRGILDETQRRLDDLNKRIHDQLEASSVEYFLSSLSERLKIIERKVRRPSWGAVIILIVAALVIGAWFAR